MHTLEDAIRQAINEAEDLEEQGLLIPSDIWEEEIHSDGYETVYSLISLFSDEEEDDGTWEEKIQAELELVYPTYF
jgi:hypothetical protein